MRAAAAAMLLVVAATAANAWEIHRRPDPLEPRASESYATVDAKEKPSQFGRAVRAWLMARCVEDRGDALAWIALSFNFSEPVAITDRLVRWRADQRPIEEQHIKPKANGRLLEIYGATEAHPTVHQLYGGARQLKAEAILPWAGSTVLTFNVTGSKEAFHKVRCRK